MKFEVHLFVHIIITVSSRCLCVKKVERIINSQR